MIPDKRIRLHDPDALSFLMGALRSHLRITADDLDAELMAKLKAAVENAERFIGRVILKSTLIETFPFSRIVHLSRPLLSVDGLEVDGTTVQGSETDVFAGTVTLPEGVEGQAVKVTYTAGMEQIPADVVNAILLIASSLFSNPMDSVETLPKASTRLLRPHRGYGL
jgi:hypothetical protein